MHIAVAHRGVFLSFFDLLLQTSLHVYVYYFMIADEDYLQTMHVRAAFNGLTDL